jgi:hypothetical protein
MSAVNMVVVNGRECGEIADAGNLKIA